MTSDKPTIKYSPEGHQVTIPIELMLMLVNGLYMTGYNAGIHGMYELTLRLLEKSKGSSKETKQVLEQIPPPVLRDEDQQKAQLEILARLSNHVELSEATEFSIGEFTDFALKLLR